MSCYNYEESQYKFQTQKKRFIIQNFENKFQKFQEATTTFTNRLLRTFSKKLQESASRNKLIRGIKATIEKKQSQVIYLTCNKSFNCTYRYLVQEKLDVSVEQNGFQMALQFNMASGGVSGIISYLLTYPIQKMIEVSKQIGINSSNEENSKEQSQNQNDSFQRKKIFYMKYFFYSGLYFGFYDTIQQVFPISEKKDFRLKGWEAILVAKVMSYPSQLITNKIKVYAEQESKQNNHSEQLKLVIDRECNKISCRNPSYVLMKLLTNFAAVTGYDFLFFGAEEQNQFMNIY